MRTQDEQSRVLYELSKLILSILRSPPSSPAIHFAADDIVPAAPIQGPRRRNERGNVAALITPAGFASFMLGISLALMLGGLVTFLIGFMLMPWVIGLVMVLYVVGFVSGLSVLGRSILCAAVSCCGHDEPGKDAQGDEKILMMGGGAFHAFVC
ncbi:hypothetical protein AKJ16_DCAP02100 [Drosera capensis]